MAEFDKNQNIDASSDNNVTSQDLSGSFGGVNFVVGDAGDNKLLGTDGIDKMYGLEGNDTIITGPGDDRAYGEEGNDVLYTGQGNDEAHGAEGRDIIFTEEGNDIAKGDAGDDIIFTMEGNDTAYGGVGNDTIKGGEGDDTLLGEDGNDRLESGAGIDTLTGGKGADTFVFDTVADMKADTITDFNAAEDKIEIRTPGSEVTASSGMSSEELVFTAGTEAVGDDSQVVYDQNTGLLTYDADGTGGQDAVEIAQLDAGTELTEDNIFTPTV